VLYYFKKYINPYNHTLYNTKKYEKDNFMTLEPFDYFNGVVGVISLLVAFYVAFKILKRAHELRRREFLMVGITGLFMSEPWWPSITSFLLEVFIGIRLPNPVAHVIGIVFQPIGIFTWLVAFTDLVYKVQQKTILVLFIIYSCIFEIAFFIVFLHDPPLEGTFYGITSALIPMAFMATFLLIILITGLLFARESIKADEPEIRMKGKLLACGIILFCIATSIDSIILLLNLFLVIQPITRIILILSSLSFYGGFLLPDWMKKIFKINSKNL